MVRYLILLTFAMLMGGSAFAQLASMQGKVLDEATGEALPFAAIAVQKGETIIASTESDFDGNYNFSNVPAGTYDVMFSYVGYAPVMLKGVVFRTGQVLKQDLVFPANPDGTGGGVDIETVVVIEYRIPIIEQGNTTGGQTLGSEDIANMATRNIGSLAATTAGVQQKDEGEDLNANGSRSSSNDTYVDGSRVFGNVGLPETEIDQVQIITSGVPAEFGDATGAIINIITKGPSSKFTGGVQLETSQFLDAFGWNRADLYFAGPLVSRVMRGEKGDTLKDGDGNAKKETLLGYRFAGTFFTSKDERPSALPSYRVTDEALDRLNASPLVRDANGGLVLATDNLTEDDIELTRVRPNVRESTGLFNGKIDFRPNRDLFFVVGGQLQYDFGKAGSTLNRLINFRDNANYRRTTWRVNGRFRHTINSTTPGNDDTGTEGDSLRLQPVFQNFSYEIQADYTREDYYQEDPRYKDRLFEYGYVGKIYRKLTPVAGFVDTTVILNSNGDTLGVDIGLGHAAYQITFEGYDANKDINPVLASYNDLVDFSQVTTMEEMEIVNGRFIGNRLSAYSLFNSPGQTGTANQEGTSYGKTNQTQLRANIRANFDLVMNRKKDPIRHSIQLGGVYEQRIERSYSINPFSLWTLADQSANSHLSFATDLERPDGGEFLAFDGRYYPTYDPLIRQDEDGNFVEMTQFGEKVRESLGKDQYDWINVHELDPSQLSLDMFDASTLVQGRSAIINYYGYDYLGNPLTTSTQFNDFFTAEDENGRKTRPVAPNKPIYVAGYIQDKFTFKDMIFNLGVRFDSYDANTKVLKDPYSLTGFYDVEGFFATNSPYLSKNDFTLPTNIGNDYVVYVSDNNPDASIVGFRDGDNWYNKEGLPVNSPNELGATIVPALQGFTTSETDPQGENYNPDLSFRDYKPSLIVMPRIAFSFPISKDANFFANYDVLSQRPPDGNFASALTYFNFRENIAAGNFIGNPNLKSQRTVNYEVGFQQKLNDFSKFKLSLLYREDRDLIQIQQYVLAYPQTYTTFGNSDFATVKSFKLEYDMRNHPKLNKNLRVLANYTLQFAEGTGSSPTSTANTAVQELKYVFPLDFDQRHTFFLNLDYRYKDGKDYNGPKINRKAKGDSTGMAKAVNLLENMGLNVSFNLASGSPYTRKEVPGGIGTSFPNRITEGSINGARMPWSFRVDFRLERDFVIAKKSKHPIMMNIYLRVQNLFNTRNVLDVYPVTGSPTDDGFLTMEDSPGLSLLANRADSYQLMYDLRMNNPFNISRPRRIYLGLVMGF